MKLPSLMSFLMLASVAACGGGGSESGQPDKIEVTPSTINATGVASRCAVGAGPTVYVHGGLPPYKLFNTLPSGIQLNVDSVARSGGNFVVAFTGQCFDSMPIKIEDALGQLGEVTLTNKPERPDTSLTPAAALAPLIK